MEHRKKLLVALSLANLAFVPGWLELLFRNYDTGYYMKRLPEASDFFAGLVDLALLTAVLFGLSLLAERSRILRPVHIGAAVLAVLIPVNFLRFMLPREVGIGALVRSGFAPIIPAVIIGLALVLVKLRLRLLALASTLLVILVPFAGLNIVRSLWAAAHADDPAIMKVPPLGTVPVTGQAPGYVVWIIFDELDYRLAFPSRPASVRLPELDRLRAQSIFATDAYAPGPETQRSIPSLLIGRVVSQVDIGGPNEILLSFEDGRPEERFQDAHTVLGEARARGAETGIVGWYHPYCRLLAPTLSRCAWESVHQTVLGRVEAESFWSSMVVQLEALSPLMSRQLHIAAYEGLREDAKVALREQQRGLLFFHFPVPHTPAIYDAARMQTTVFEWSNVEGYIGNMALADEMLGDVRREMEALGSWDRASVIVSADHPWRESRSFDGKQDARVPFLLKLPGQHAGIEHTARFETLGTGRLALELIATSSATEDLARGWMQRNRTEIAGAI